MYVGVSFVSEGVEEFVIGTRVLIKYFFILNQRIMDLSKHNITWDKLEEAIKYSESQTSPEPSVKYRKNSSHIPRKPKYDIRSKSSCKETPSLSSRPQTASTSFCKSFQSYVLDTLSTSDLQQIYSAKCQDLQIPVIPDQEKRFFNFCFSSFKDRKFSLKESGLGLSSAKTLGNLLKNNPNFAFFDFSKNNLKDEGSLLLLKNLKKSISLVHLDLSSNEISAEGSESILLEIVNHPSLVSLNLSSHEGMHRNRVGLVGSRVLALILQENSVLSFLNLAGTGLGPEGIELLAEGLKGNFNLTSLNLANNLIGFRAVENLLEVVSRSGICELNLAMNKLGNEGCEYVGLMLGGGFGKIADLKKLDLSENEISTPGLSKLFAALRINAQLNFLNLSHNNFSKGLSQNLLQFLTENISISTLNLSHCYLKCESLLGLSEGISKNQGVRVLILSNNFIEDRGCESISYGVSKNRMIQVLDLSSNKIKDRGGVALAKASKMNNTLTTLLLKDNSIKDETGHLLADITRVKKNMIKVNLDLNPVNLKYVHEININLRNNSIAQQKMIVPKLQQALERINIKSSAIESLQTKIQNKEKEKQDIEHKLKTQGQKFDQVSKIEAEKLKELNDEYHALREYSQKLSEEIDDLNNQLYVRPNQKLRLLIERESNEYSEKIGYMAIEVKKLEKNSILYIGQELKQEINLKKSQTFAVINKYKEELTTVENRKKNEENMILFLQNKIEEKKKAVENIKNPKSKEEHKGFLASEKLASEKKNSSLSPVKGKGFKVWSPKKNRRTNSSVRNK